MTEVVEDDATLEEGIRFPPSTFAPPGVDLITGQEYGYFWKQSEYSREVVNFICLNCNGFIVLVQPDDVMLKNETKLIVQLDGSNIETELFL